MVIFELSQPSRKAHAQVPCVADVEDIPEKFRRKQLAALPEVSELDAVRHYTGLSRKNFSIDGQFYPLGSCTMKYNPRGVHRIASLPGFLNRHPDASLQHSQGFLQCAFELQALLAEITGMTAVALSPMAGAHGEFVGVAMIRAYHQSRGDHARREILVPDAAHGTNPASAVMCGYDVRELPTRADGDVDLEQLKMVLGPQTAGIMLTNPSTLGVFERQIKTIADRVHNAGGLLYYDGANLNAILGKVRPGEMGFDVMHLNLHKTLATPHGGGGPGAGPVAVNDTLKPFLPVPSVVYQQGQYRLTTLQDAPQSIGRVAGFIGNAGIILRAYLYLRLLGKAGITRVGEIATLNANYLLHCLREVGYVPAYPKRRASHEFIVTLQALAKETGVTAMDVGKRLLDYGFHAPTTYFPLLVPECLLIEPTETESKETLDAFVAAMATILREAKEQPEYVKQAPYTLPVRRLDNVKAARELDVRYHDT